ncbi:DinB family protein [Pseudactinotalea sp. Z1732]|uniref:DinB family protein n=1 Tax=Micrococcales TaxID=85006 RepID=UPI003C79F8DD
MPERSIDLAHQLAEQLRFHWETAARPRLHGLSDAEYLWEPVEEMWSVRPRGSSEAPIQGGRGDWVIEFAVPEPEPAPVTTIAWRMGHVIVGVFGTRNHSHFAGPPMDYFDFDFDYAGTAAEALAQLDQVYAHWIGSVAGLDDEALARPVGEAEGHFAEEPMIALVLHIHREAIHHMAEIALLRDLYLRQG